MLIPLPPEDEIPDSVKVAHTRWCAIGNKPSECPDTETCKRAVCTENYCALRESMDIQKDFSTYVESCNQIQKNNPGKPCQIKEN